MTFVCANLLPLVVSVTDGDLIGTWAGKSHEALAADESFASGKEDLVHSGAAPDNDHLNLS
jgi:hypothetical protein